MHSSAVRISDDFTNKRVLVVGGAVSGTDIAEKVANSSTQVIHLFRRPRWILQKNLPNSSGKILPWDIADTYKTNAKTLSPEEKFQNFSEICQAQQQYPEWRMTQEHPFAMVFADNYLEKVKEKRITLVQGEIDHFTHESAVLKNGQEIQFDIVIFCTGYKTDMSFLHDPSWIDPNTKRLYLNMFPLNSAGIAILGMHPASRFSLLAQQAEFACHILSGNGKLPSDEEMHAEMDKLLALAPVDYMNTLAQRAGSFPNIEQFKDENPRLYRILKTSPFLPSQNKLMGPYQNPTAAIEIIYDADEYLRSVANDEVGLAVDAMVANANRAQRRM